MTNEPLVSVLMTSYNREPYISEAIDSVLDSHFTNFELIIVDDCSTDNTVAIAKGYEAKDKRIHVYVNEKNLGDYPNRNKAASYAKGKYLKYLDSDDKIYPYSLDIMLDAMERNPQTVLGLCYSQVQYKELAFPVLFTSRDAYYHHFFKGGLLFPGPSASIVRSDYFKNEGGFSGKRYVSDTELWLKIVQQTNILIFQPSLIWWRMHEGQEYDLGHVNEDYLRLTYELNKSFLESENCPLQEKDRLIAIRNYKNRFARKIYKKIINGKFSQVREMKNYSNMSINEILQGLIPVNRIKKLLYGENN